MLCKLSSHDKYYILSKVLRAQIPAIIFFVLSEYDFI